MSKFIWLLISSLPMLQVSFAAEVQLSGAQIAAMLNNNVLYGETNGQATDQIFQKNGVTYYHIGSGQSQGQWKVVSDQFCSQWSPNPAWVCYDVTREGQSVIFISPSGERSEMILSK